MNLYKVAFKKSAQKELASLPKTAQIKILKAIRLLSVDPFHSILPTRKMAGTGSDNYYRLRVGTYRVIYAVQNEILTIIVVRVGHRKEVYR